MADLSATTGTWAIDPTHSNIGFSVRHAMVAKVRGRFTDFAGTFVLDGANPAASTAEITIQTASIDTANADRDGHLKSADFFSVESNAVLSFTSTSVTQKGDDTFVVTGDLTLGEHTKSVDVEFEFNGTSTDPYGNARVGFEGEAEISRKDFGLNFNVALDTGGVLVGDAIKIILDIAAIKQ
jgi:polyisoprenoid-binding protein YceI